MVIDPGRVFGTGAHPTTRLCLELLAELPRGSLVDIGCGSGVIAIGGAKLGFAPGPAVDVDAEAVEVARQNAAANEVDVALSVLDARSGELPETDVAVANIALDAVEAVGGGLRSRLAVTSGYLVSEQPMLAAFRIRERRERDGGRPTCTSAVRVVGRWRPSRFAFSAARSRTPTPRPSGTRSTLTGTSRWRIGPAATSPSSTPAA